MRITTAICSLVLLAAAATAGARDWAVEETRTLRETVTFEESSAGRRLLVNNLYGEIKVRAHGGSAVEMIAVETLRAESPAAAERARAEVRLEVRSDGGAVDLFVDGPFRSPHDRYEWASTSREPGYQVEYDFELRVPRRTDLDLRTVMHGDIEVSGVEGAFQLSNVNGAITMKGLAGSGRAKTVNGSIIAEFDRNPDGDSEFTTVNGRIETHFQPGLAADLRLQTRWGEVWSEFEVSPLPLPPPVKKQKNGQLVIRTSEGSSVRVAGGGPTITYQTLNGDILVRKARKD